MPTMRAIQIPRAKGPFELVERPIPEVMPGSVRIRVQACGICHSDVLAQQGLWPGITYPRVPGHEVVGVVDAVAKDVAGFAPGQRVGVGWHGGSCGYCGHCRRGWSFACENVHAVTGLTYDGGYAEYMVAPASAVALVPEGLAAADAAPLMCAGITTFNALRNCGAGPGETVAIQGIGGLGHLGVQFAAKMGFRTVAIARGADKAALARSLGAHHYIDSQAGDPAEALTKLGGARAILSTVTDGAAMQAVLGGLGPNGVFLIVGAVHTVQVPALQLLSGRQAVKGWYSGTAIDSQDTLAFSVLTGVRSQNEVLPLEKAAEGFDRMMSGKARFRVVLTA
jgi:D-arabinose 1-dehydrogenase-like Zn-dependent alcohol dehydrogenase